MRLRTMFRSRWGRAGALVATSLVVAGVAVGAWSAAGMPPRNASVGAQPVTRRSAALRPPRTVPARVPPATLTAAAPRPGASGVDGATAVVFRTNVPVAMADLAATVSPPIAGRWSTAQGSVVFTPSGAFPPSTKVTVSLSPRPGGATGFSSTEAVTTTFTTASGSVLRLQQMLALLGYLPLRWTASPAQSPSLATAQRDVFDPPAGAFAWTWSAPPASLVSQWSPGGYTAMVRGAVMGFEADHGLAVDGIAGPEVWSALLAATGGTSLSESQAGYTYAVASKARPETLTVWHDGTVLATTPANTGIPAAPTADGTFPVYERLATQVMKGTNPNGTHYADPVAWVAYFNGGDAIHYIGRASYGYPQSLGCVEVPYQVGKTIWPYLRIGTLVTVTG